MFNHTSGSSADVLDKQLSSFLSHVMWLLTRLVSASLYVFVCLYVHVHGRLVMELEWSIFSHLEEVTEGTMHSRGTLTRISSKAPAAV